MQTDSPFGVRKRCTDLQQAAARCLRTIAAVLALVAQGILAVHGFGQVSEPSFPVLERPSSQLESLLGYGGAGVGTTAQGQFDKPRSTTAGNWVEVPATANSHQREPELQQPTPLPQQALAPAWKPQAIGDQPAVAYSAPAIRRPDSINSAPTAGSGPVANSTPATLVGYMEAGQSSDPLDQPLPGPSQPANRSESVSSGLTPGFGHGAKSLLQTGVALVVVLGLMFGFVWLFKRTAPKSLLPLPIETVQVLGNAPLHGKQHLRLIRLGQRVLLLAVSETTSRTLAEVTDPDEVQYLLQMCEGKNARHESQTFDAILRENGRERTKGFLGSQQDQVSQSIGSSEKRATAARESTTRSAVRPVSNHFFEA
ncbi:MAG: flagellar biosynthetic protein FliO [Pirellulaceae bacterium]|nr:flagellar biosynthetic protein FliO [Pirellulaceae bacterium]